jgi:putative iron-dependent peroxidase
MFIGKPPGNYDRLLDFTRPVTGNLFFVPSATFLEDVPVDEPAAAAAPGSSSVQDARSHRPMSDGSLRIGSLKGQRHHE